MDLYKWMESIDDLHFGKNIYMNTSQNAALFSYILDYLGSESSVEKYILAYGELSSQDFDVFDIQRLLNKVEWFLTEHYLYLKDERVELSVINEIHVSKEALYILFRNRWLKLCAKKVNSPKTIAQFIKRLSILAQLPNHERAMVSHDVEIFKFNQCLLRISHDILEKKYVNLIIGNQFDILVQSNVEALVKSLGYDRAIHSILFYDDTMMLNGKKGLMLTSSHLLVYTDETKEKYDFLYIDNRPTLKSDEKAIIEFIYNGNWISIDLFIPPAAEAFYNLFLALYDYLHNLTIGEYNHV